MMPFSERDLSEEAGHVSPHNSTCQWAKRREIDARHQSPAYARTDQQPSSRTIHLPDLVVDLEDDVPRFPLGVSNGYFVILKLFDETRQPVKLEYVVYGDWLTFARDRIYYPLPLHYPDDIFNLHDLPLRVESDFSGLCGNAAIGSSG
jgi:hypothetical protein